MKDKVIEDIISIPFDRMGAVIGKDGITRKEIEKKTDVKIRLNSKNGEAIITRKIYGDTAKSILAKDVIKAIAIGFAPEKALKLLEDNIYLDVIYLSGAARNNKDLERMKARIIGRNGKSREKIAKKTQTNIVIYDESVAIIGRAEDITFAREAIERIVKGAPHSAVFKFVDRISLE